MVLESLRVVFSHSFRDTQVLQESKDELVAFTGFLSDASPLVGEGNGTMGFRIHKSEALEAVDGLVNSDVADAETGGDITLVSRSDFLLQIIDQLDVVFGVFRGVVRSLPARGPGR